MPFPSPFSGSDEPDATFDEYDEFVPEHLPDPGPFLEGHDLLTGAAHVAFRRATREVFEARGVRDATFGYNLARLDLDTRHPDAGYRYAREESDPSVLRAEFTPTTAFCPGGETLAKGSFRAWNGLAAEHGYDLVRVRVAPMHDDAERINRTLARLEQNHLETGELGVDPGASSGPDDSEGDSRPSTPF